GWCRRHQCVGPPGSCPAGRRRPCGVARGWRAANRRRTRARGRGAAAHRTREGEARGIHTDNFGEGESTTRWQLETGHGTVDVLPTTVPALTQGNNEVGREDQAPGAAVAGPVQAAAGFATPTLGAHKVAVIAFNFLNDTSQPWTTDMIRSNIFTSAGSTNAFFKEETSNAFSLTGKTRADGD